MNDEAAPLNHDAMIDAMHGRRAMLGTRVGLAVILATVFFPNTGWIFATIWLAAYLTIQALEFAWLKPVRVGEIAETIGGRRLIVGLVALNNVIFGLFGAREAMSGAPAALACATLLLAGASFNAVLTSHRCRPLLMAGLIPAATFNLSVPLGAWIGGSTTLHVALLTCGVLLYFLVIGQALKLVNHVFAAERRAREAAESAEAARARMVANVSHELRTPLNAVIASASLLRLSTLNARDAEAVSHLTTGATTLKALISDILDASKAEAGAMELLEEPFDAVATTKAGADLFRASAEAKGLKLSFETGAGQAWVHGDAMRLGQIIANLCSNAIKFTDTGEITIGLAVIQEGDKTRLDLSVADTGMGMDSATAARMFQPFVQADASTARRFGGTGLGLSISKAFAEAMGGTLAVESAVGRGSVFRLTAVLRTAEPVEVSPSPPDAVETPLGLRRPSVLVADDNLANRRLISLILGDLCDVVAVEDGAKALDLIAQQSFDLLITDLQMPVMDGPTALAELRRREASGCRRLRALLATADAQVSQAAAEAMGADGVVTKPFTALELIDAVRRQVAFTQDRPAIAARLTA